MARGIRLSTTPLRRKILRLGYMWKQFASSDFVRIKFLGDIQRWIVAVIWIAIFIAMFTYGARKDRNEVNDRHGTYQRALNF